MRTFSYSLASRPVWQQWALLLPASAIFVVMLELLHVPAALLLGPMAAGIIVGCCRSTVRIPTYAFRGAQAIVGCLIAASLSPKVIQIFIANWWLFLLIILSAVIASSIMGYTLARLKIMPGSTAVWGTTPGAAATMVIMSDAFGADMRMVAFMQYLRVLITSFAASIVAALVIPDGVQGAVQTIFTVEWFPPIVPGAFAWTVIISVIGCLITAKLRIPGGYILLPLMLGGFLHGMGCVELQLPEWLLAISYALLGWRIGLSFDVDSLRHAYKVLPHVLASILILMLFCGILAWVLVVSFDVDPLTAYLATSPGGLDTIAVIVASRPYADMSFVMTLQIVRLLILNLICPPLAKFLARYTNKKNITYVEKRP